MRIRCPHCHQPIELVQDDLTAEVLCTSCGSSFSLIAGESATQDYVASQRIIGQFNLLERVGMGKFGAVWKARDTQLDRIVAVKVPRKDQLSSAEMEKFFREARTAAQLKHPNIIGVHEVGREGDSVYIVSDFVQGANLHEWLSARRLTPREAAELCAKISDAVAHAHAAGIVHRDLKPGNIMLDGDGQPHITDFGLAKREAGEITMTADGAILGTPAYMSPEQARGDAHHADARSDVYSLGVILFELLTGELPFRGETRMLILQILNDEPPSPRKLNARIPRDLETICFKCLQKDRGKRYAAAGDLSADLRRFLRGEAIHARPVTRLARAWRWCKRKPLITAISALLIALLVMTTILSSLIAQRGMALSDERLHRTQEAQAALYRNLLHSAELANLARQPGYRQVVFDALRRAAEIETDQKDLKSVKAIALPGLGDPIGLPQLNDVPSVPLCSRLGSGELGPTRLKISLDREAMRIIAEDGSTVGTLRDAKHPVGAIHSVAFSPDSQYIAIAHEKGFRVTAIPSMSSELRVDGDVIDDVAFHPGSDLLATLSDTKTIELWSAGSGRRIQAFGPFQGLDRIAFSQDGELLVALGPDGNPRIAWNIASTPERRIINAHAGAMVTRVCFAPVGNIIGTTGKDGYLRLWDRTTGRLVHECKANQSGVEAVAFSPDVKLVATGDWEGTVILWDVASGQRIAMSSTISLANQIWQLLFVRDGAFLVVGCGMAGFVFEVHATDGTWLKRKQIIPSDVSDVISIPNVPDFIFGASRGGHTSAYQLLGNHASARVPFATDWNANGRVFASSVDKVFFHGPGEELCSVQWLDGKFKFAKSKVALPRSIAQMAVTADGRWVATPGKNPAQLSILNVESGDEMLSLPKGAAHIDIRSISWSSDGRMLAVAQSDGIAAIWDLGKVREILGRLGISVDSTETPKSTRLNENKTVRPESVFAECRDARLWEASLPLWENRLRLVQDDTGTVSNDAITATKDLAEAYELAGQQKKASDLRARTAQLDLTASSLLGGASPIAGARRIVTAAKSDLSPDGARLVFTLPDLAGDLDRGLQVVELVNGAVRPLASAGRDPAWCPSGNGLIAYARRKENSTEEIRLIDADGSHDRSVASGAYPHWSGDGKTLYFFDPPNNSIEAVSIDQLDSPPRPICKVKESRYPVVSPDGSRVAYAGPSSGLAVAEIASGKVIHHWLVGSKQMGGIVAWCPDGKKLAYGGWPINGPGLWLADLETGKTRLVIPGNAWRPAWSNDGKHFLFAVGNDTYIVDADKLPVP